MKSEDIRTSNMYNLQVASNYLGIGANVLQSYYRELLEDNAFLTGLNTRVAAVRQGFGFSKDIFSLEQLDSIDQFAFQRVLLYVLIRYLKPEYCLETGVYYGGNTAFMLNALYRNGSGRLVSIDLPDAQIRAGGRISRHPQVGDRELYTTDLSPGFLIPDYLRPAWDFIEGDSLATIPTLKQTFDLFIHDSEHSHDFVMRELTAADALLSENAIFLVDNIDWSNAFFRYCVEQRYYPTFFTGNGKHGHQVSTGMVWKRHPSRQLSVVVGSTDGD